MFTVNFLLNTQHFDSRIMIKLKWYYGLIVGCIKLLFFCQLILLLLRFETLTLSFLIVFLEHHIEEQALINLFRINNDETSSSLQPQILSFIYSLLICIKIISLFIFMIDGLINRQSSYYFDILIFQTIFRAFSLSPILHHFR